MLPLGDISWRWGGIIPSTTMFSSTTLGGLFTASSITILRNVLWSSLLYGTNGAPLLLVLGIFHSNTPKINTDNEKNVKLRNLTTVRIKASKKLMIWNSPTVAPKFDTSKYTPQLRNINCQSQFIEINRQWRQNLIQSNIHLN